MRYLIALCLALWGTTTTAEDYISFDTRIGAPTFICDKPDSVLAFLDSDGMTRLPDCGNLVGRVAWPVTVTIIEPYEYDGRTFYIAQFAFAGDVPWGVPIQYGFWAGDVPDLEPAGMSL